MVLIEYLYLSLREAPGERLDLLFLRKYLMSSLRLVNYEVTLPGWYVYLICESLTSQNKHSIF